jgi:hypothetical protein
VPEQSFADFALYRVAPGQAGFVMSHSNLASTYNMIQDASTTIAIRSAINFLFMVYLQIKKPVWVEVNVRPQLMPNTAYVCGCCAGHNGGVEFYFSHRSPLVYPGDNCSHFAPLKD